MTPLLTVREVSTQLGLDQRTIRKMIKKGEVPTVSIGTGKQIRIPSAWVDRVEKG